MVQEDLKKKLKDHGFQEQRRRLFDYQDEPLAVQAEEATEQD